MKSYSTVFACLGLICAAPVALAQTVNVAAGELEDAVESLGRQTGVNVLYPGDLLKGRTTGVAGTLSPAQAFAVLLEGTSLTATQEYGAMRIAQASPPRPVAAPPEAVKSSAQAPAQSTEKSTCRNVSSLTGVVQSMCGTAAQWAEFDRRMVKLDKGFSCKPVPGSRPLCLFAKQWQYVERNNLLRSNAPGQNGFGLVDGARESAMAIEHNEYNAVRQDLLDSANGRPLPIP
jgi:hypothetical protein